MSFLEQETYTFEDIQTLIDNGAEEGLYLEFKAAGSLASEDKKRREIAKDISAFANADGGILVYGIEEKEHKAFTISPINGNEYTKEWLEQVIHDNIHRPIDGLRIFPIRQDDNIKQSIYVVKIPRSTNAPHMSADKCYYKRHNFKVLPMEEYEVRDMFFRENTPQLMINGAWLTAHFDGPEYIKYKFEAQIVNIGNNVANQCKLNCYIMDSPEIISLLGWDTRNENIDYTIVHPNKVKISAMNRMPIYPQESMDLLRFEFKIPHKYVRAFEKKAKMELILFCGKKTEEEQYTAHELLFYRRLDD